MQLVHTEIVDRVALITLDDPGCRNALSVTMSEQLVEAIADLRTGDAAGAVVLTGAPPAFSAGANLDDLANATPERLQRIYAGFLAMVSCPYPTIAAVNGAAVGAGLNLALACDVRLAGRAAHFEARFLQLGLHPGGGHGWMLDRILGSQGAAAVALLGEPLDGEAAARHGLAWRCVDDDALLETARTLAARAAAAPPELVRRMKASLRAAGAQATHDEAVRFELEHQVWSAAQPEFQQRLEALRRRIAAKGTSP